MVNVGGQGGSGVVRVLGWTVDERIRGRKRSGVAWIRRGSGLSCRGHVGAMVRRSEVGRSVRNMLVMAKERRRELGGTIWPIRAWVKIHT